MRKKILLFVLAIACGVSMIFAGIVSAFAGFSNGSFTVDEVLTDYGQYKAVETVNAGTVDLSGQYQITADYGPITLDLDSSEPILLFDAPEGFSVYYRNTYTGGLGSLYDRIFIQQDGPDLLLICELEGEQIRRDYTIPGAHVFIVPTLPNYGDGEQNRVFNSADFVTVYKLGDVDPVPPGGGGGSGDAVYDRIDQVWSDLFDNMVTWLRDADQYFFTEGSLTALGLCCAVPIGVGVMMLVDYILIKFLRLGG